MKRSIKLEGLDQELILSKATAVKTDKNMIHLDQLPDGTWRLIYNAKMIPDFTKLSALTIVRDEVTPYHISELPRDVVDCIVNSKMDSKHDHLNELLK